MRNIKSALPSLTDDLRAIIEEAADEESNELRSPDLLDQVVWQVLVGFLVNIAAGLFTELVVFSRKKSLTRKDLDEIRRCIEERKFEPSGIDAKQVENAVGTVLPDWVREEKRGELAKQLTEVMLTCVEKTNESKTDEYRAGESAI